MNETQAAFVTCCTLLTAVNSYFILFCLWDIRDALAPKKESTHA